MDRMELEKYWINHLPIDEKYIESRFNVLIEEFVKNKGEVPDNDVFFNHITNEVELIIFKDIMEKVEKSYNHVYSKAVISLFGNGDGYVEFFRKFIDMSLESLMDCKGLKEIIRWNTAIVHSDKRKELVDRGIIDDEGDLVGRKE